MKNLKDRFERRTGIIFGCFRGTRPHDFVFILRLGTGRGLCCFEAGVFGRSVYVDFVGRNA